MDHIKQLVNVAAEYVTYEGKSFLLERTVNGLLKMAVRLARKEDLASMVVQQSLSILLNLKKNSQALPYVARHISYGLHELLRNNAANIHKTEDWNVIFSLMEMIGGVEPSKVSTYRGLCKKFCLQVFLHSISNNHDYAFIYTPHH